MKRIVLSLAVALTMVLPLTMMAKDRKMVHTDASELTVCGKICDNTYEQYSRLPGSLEGVTSNAIWRLGRNSAGIYVRFRSDAGMFEFKWGSVLSWAGPHYVRMLTGVSVQGRKPSARKAHSIPSLASLEPPAHEAAGGYGFADPVHFPPGSSPLA